MQRKVGILFFIALIAGAILRTGLHLENYNFIARGHGHHQKHHHLRTVAVCKMDNSPITISNPQIVLNATPAGYIIVNTQPLLTIAAFFGGSEQARAPPVA